MRSDLSSRVGREENPRGAQKESASAHRYLQWHGPSSFQPVNKTAVMLEVPGAESTGHKKHVVGIEGLAYRVCLNTKTPIIDDVLRG